MNNSGDLDDSIIFGLVIAATAAIVGVVLVAFVLVLGAFVVSSSVGADGVTAIEQVADVGSDEESAAPTPPAESALIPVEPATATPIPTVQPTPPPPATDAIGRIAAINANFQLVSVDPNGNDLRTLSGDDRRAYQFPVWSNDGSMIAAIHTNRRRTRGGITVFQDSVNATSTVPFDSSETIPIYLYWAPNDELISFIAPGSSGLGFQVVPPDGTQETRVLSEGTPFYWDWTSDSRRILIHRGSAENNTSEMGVFTLATGDYRTLNEDAGGFFQSPDVAPNDRNIAYAEGVRSSDRELILTDLEGDDRSTIDHNGIASMSWSPLGDKLAFTASEQPINSTFGPLRLATPDGDVTVLERRTVLAFFWSPNGRRIAYFMPPTASDAELEAALRRRRANPSLQTQESFRVALWVVDTVTGDREQLGLFQPTALFWNQFLPFFDQYARSHSIWSPDSDALILPVNDDGTDKIYRFFVDRRVPTLVTDGSIAFWSHQ